MKMLLKIASAVEKNPLKCLLTVTGTYFFLFSFLSILKYRLFLYNSIDLAIFNQVFWNTLHGNPFWFTITFPHSYLADHVSLLMMLELPIYALFQHPITLLILQTLALGGAAIPLFFISKTLWQKTAINQRYANCAALSIAILWLLNPLVHNINLFEYHELAFFPLFIFLATYGYLMNKKAVFLIGYILTATIREDTGIMLIGLIAIMTIDIWRRKNDRGERLWFITAAITASTAWTIIAYAVINHFSPEGTRYTSYFSALGNSIPEILKTIASHPLSVFRRLFSIRNVAVAAAPLLPLLFLPLARPKYLLLAAVPLGALFLANPSQSTISYIYLHYSAAVIPGVFISFAAATAWFCARNSRDNIILATIIVAVSTIYIGISLGPFVPDNLSALSEIISRRRTNARELEFTSERDAVLAETWLLPVLSARTTLYDLRRVYIGNIEFTAKKYSPPCNVNRALISNVDLAEMVMREQFIGYANLKHVQRLISCSQPEIRLTRPIDLSYDLSAPTIVQPKSASFVSNLQTAINDSRIVIGGTFTAPPTNRPDALLWRIEAFDQNTKRGAVAFQLAAEKNFSINISSRHFIEIAKQAGQIRFFLVHNRMEMRPAWLNSLMPIILPPLQIFDAKVVKLDAD